MDKKKLLAKWIARQADLVSRSEKTEDITELRSINAQLTDVRAMIDDIQQEIAADDEARACGGKDKKGGCADDEDPKKDKKSADPSTVDPDGRTASVTAGAESRGLAPGAFSSIEVSEDRAAQKYLTDMEERGKALRDGKSFELDVRSAFMREQRAVTTTSGIVIPSFTSNTLNPAFNQISSIVDGVHHTNLQGGESYQKGYIIGTAEGTYTAEGAQAANTDMTFGYADINKNKITAYSEVTEELLKLSNVDYAGEIQNGIQTSIRMKLARQVLVGEGGTSALVGIFSANAAAIDAATDLSLSAITDETLDQIVFTYGGDEDVEGTAVLILNKLDLLAFAKVRTSTKQKFYDIQTRGNVGTINGVPFIINSACAQLTATADATTPYCMAYGNLANYELTTFSPIEVAFSKDYKFREGMIAHRGVVFAGGNVAHKNGFLRIKRAAKA
jgi:HK97 family phage major capsid protein